MGLQYTAAIRNARQDEFTAAIGNAAKLRIYSGTKPATPATALSGNTLLAELTCGSPFAPAASGGVLTLSAISDDVSADATGTATFFRVYDSGGSICHLQGDVGISGSDLNLVTTSLVAGEIVRVTSFTITDGGA